jgi:hypothetical protein
MYPTIYSKVNKRMRKWGCVQELIQYRDARGMSKAGRESRTFCDKSPSNLH